MAVIKLTFQPDTTQIKPAIEQIKQELNGISNINIRVDNAGAKATQQLASNIKQASSSSVEFNKQFQKMYAEAKRLSSVYGDLQKLTATYGKGGELTGAIASFGKANEAVREFTLTLGNAGEVRKKLSREIQNDANIQQRLAKEQAAIERQNAKDELEYERETSRQINEVHAEQHRIGKSFIEQQNQYLREQAAERERIAREQAEQEAARVRQEAEANKQIVKDEQAAAKQRHDDWKAYIEQRNAEEQAYRDGAAQAEKEIRANQQATWRAFLQGEQAYRARLAELDAERVKQAQAANRQMVIDEEEAAKRRHDTWAAYINQRNAEEREAEANRQRGLASVDAWVDQYNASMNRAQNTAISLDRQFANLVQTLNNARAQYPAGTFDQLETQVREAWGALRGLDNTSQTYIEDVDALKRRLAQLNAQYAETRAETQKLDKVTESLRMNIEKFARWYLIGNAFTKILNQFRQALSTMKEVDKELANIQKVTNRTNIEMEQLADSAYGVASSYGIQASSYLESVAEFAKAGYGNQSEALAELATKAQLVGDTTATVANKFLIAGDAAWKMGGDVNRLSAVLDSANTIENNFATTIDKLAQGFPIVASIAAQAGMTTEQTMAALGTITSVTQETGTKAATALRALILNIIGAVGEYEDGLEVTEESIKSLDGLLQVYAKDALKAADAAGTVVNPIEAIAALSKASKEGLLNQAELFEVLSSLGGKLRTNQLTALVQNFDMFNEMLEMTATSAGSADKEIGILLANWESKTNILKNTWTKFISHILDTDLVKGALDAITKLIKTLDTDIGRAASLTVAFGAVLARIFGGGGWLTLGLTSAIGLISLIVTGINSVKNAAESWTKKAQETYGYYEKIKSQLDVLKSKGDELTETEKARLTILQQEADNAEREAKAKAQTAYWSAYGGGTINLPFGITVQPKGSGNTVKGKNYGSLFGISIVGTGEGNTEAGKTYGSLFGPSIVGTGEDRNPDKSKEQAINLIRAYQEATKAFFNAENLDDMNAAEEKMADVTEEITKMANNLQDLSEILRGDLPQTGQDALKILLAFLDGLHKVNEETKDVVIPTKNLTAEVKTFTDALKEFSEATNKQDEAIGEVVEALKKYGPTSIEAYNAMKKLESVIPNSTDKLYDFETATLLSTKALDADKASLLDLIDAEKQVNFQNAIDEMNAVADAAWNMWAAEAMAVQGLTDDDLLRAGEWMHNTSVDVLLAEKAKWDAYVKNLRQRGDYQPTDTRTYTHKEDTTDPELVRLQSIVSLRKSELELLKASGASDDEIIAKEREIQAALHNQAEYMRGILADMEKQGKSQAEIEAYQADINALSTEWWNIQKDILETQQALFDTLSAVIDQYYDAAVADKEKELELEQKILDVQKAQIALQNAQNERNVRYFNAHTGQWEWGANIKNVQVAKDALQKAQDDLNKYQKEQAWAEFKSAWAYVTEQIKSGAMTFQEAYEYMYDKMKGLQDKFGVKISDVFGTGMTMFLLSIRTAMEGADNPEKVIKELADAIRAGTLDIENTNDILKALNGEYAGISEETARILAITKMRANSLAWYEADKDGKAALHADNQTLAQKIGADWNPSGYWDVNGQHLYDPKEDATVSATKATYTSTDAEGHTYTVGSEKGKNFIDNAAPGSTMEGGDGSQWVKNENGSTTVTSKSGRTYQFYDSGGILHGKGAIKATARDELVLPPDITSKLLSPVNNGIVSSRMDDMRWMLGLRNEPGRVSNSIGTQNNGDNYVMNGVTIGEQQARSMTVYDLAQMARSLGTYQRSAS